MDRALAWWGNNTSSHLTTRGEVRPGNVLIMELTTHKDWVAADRDKVWHPYSAIGADLPVFPVQSAHGVRLRLADGRELIDGMSSWWCAIHGYNHPILNRAVEEQLADMSHVMFGGLTHRPAVELAQRLVELTPDPLQTVFFC